MIDTTKAHWRTVDTDFIQFLIERHSLKTTHVLWIWFYLHGESHVVQFTYDNQKERDDVWENIDEEDCMELYNAEKAKLN